MNNRKRIAILVGQAEELYQEQFISGFLSEGFRYNYDVCVFAMYQRYQESATREIGESSIYSLIDYTKFDAVVLMLDTIQTPGVAKQIEEIVKKEFDGPVLCVDVESRYFPSIEIDYYESAKSIVSHLIDYHGLTDIAYLTGRKNHKHAEQRLKAYVDCMKEHDLPISENRVFYGDFWYGGGEQMAEALLKSGEKMPQAIACANDYMAIGVAKTLTKHGLKVPEDVAVVGYDSVEVGKDSPKPITSIPIATRKYGVYAATCIKALFEGKELEAFQNDDDFFIGSSCGCHNDSIIPRVILRDGWNTDGSEMSFFSLNNHMNEDLLCQNTFFDLMNTLNYYVYHIRDFDEFHICLNEDWDDFEKKIQEGREHEIYSERMLHVMKCDRVSEGDVVSYDDYFKTDLMLPELYEDHSEPSAYFFTPLHFEEKSFGYAVLCYRNKPRSYSATYRMWLRNVMQELECFRRIEAIQKSKQLLETSMTRDALTGLFNYNGFSNQIDSLLRKILKTDFGVGVLVIDIKELMKINATQGRTEGDRVIITVANILKDIFSDGMSVCLGNGEMFALLLSKKDTEVKLQQNLDVLLQQIEEYNHNSEKKYSVEIYSGYEVGMPQNREELERLVNVAVSKKNGSKVNERKMIQGQKLTEEEYKEAQIVQELLDHNRFNYHFQPIVNAKNGEIFAYEALMRPDVEPYMPPPVVLKYAEYFDRLYDVEKATFFNVLDIVKKNSHIFDGSKKIFINSIPGNLLHGEDALEMEKIAEGHKNTVVVELTEQMEMTDDELVTLKEYYSKIGFQTAIDDYGTGYSNVTNLLRYMPDCVKIDRMLLTNIQESPQKQHFVKDIITFCHDNDISVLAEGVETQDELNMVIHLGVDLIQGYYTAKPSGDIVPSIARSIKNEIVEFNKMESHNRGRRVYVSGKESRISLARLVAEKYSIIEITDEETAYRDVTIYGVPDLDTDIYIRVKKGYRGRIVLDNVTLQGEKHGASIDIGNDCDVTLEIHGDNRCINGGIRVPVGAKLTLKGDGHLRISVDAANYFGIGNDIDARHGELVFEQDGIIDLRGSGMKGVGIGSGQGGIISILRGKYIIHLIGQEGVGVGSYTGDVMPVIKECDLRIDIATAKAVGVGSMMGNVHIRLEHLAWIGEFNADNVVGIGTLEGKKCYVDIGSANVMINLRAYKSCGIGSDAGETSVGLDNGAVLITGNGVDAIAAGNHLGTAEINVNSGKLESRLNTTSESDLGCAKDGLHISNGECFYHVNGKLTTIYE